MTILQRILIYIGLTIGFLLGVGMDVWPSRWLTALIVSFFAIVGGVWATSYATRNEVQ